MKKIYHKISIHKTNGIWLHAGQWGVSCYTISRDNFIDPVSEDLRIKIPPEALFNYLKETNAIFSIRKAKTWYHVEDIVPGKREKHVTIPIPKVIRPKRKKVATTSWV